MPTQPQIFRDQSEGCAWIFDFFAHAFDFLNGRFFPPALEARDTDWDREEDDVRKRNLVELIATADGDIPVEVWRYLRVPSDDTGLQSIEFCFRLYCALSAIDRAAADLNYLAAFVRPVPGRWAKTTEHFERKRHQLQRSAPGQLIFQPRDFEAAGRTWHTRALAGGHWTELPKRGRNLSDYFQNLLRVPESSDCSVDIHVLSPAQDIEMDNSELRVGVVPLVDTLEVNATDASLLPGPLRIAKQTSSPPTFTICIQPSKGSGLPCEELCQRADAALRYLADRGAQIVVFPEMVVPDPVLARLRDVLYELSDSGKKCPALIVAGTFSRDSKEHPSSMPFNVAVALNDRGQELWRQRKLQPYEMKRYEQQRFGLEAILNSDSCMEYMSFVPRHLQFIDSRRTGLRMVTLICEDATRSPGLTRAQELRANLILVPVMAGPVGNESGFAENLDRIVNDYDAVFVVANSGPLARAVWDDATSSPPLGILGVPLLRPANSHKSHVLLNEPTPVPGIPGLQALYYQLPEA
jgi:Carbon-nitrogen hydrolase